MEYLPRDGLVQGRGLCLGCRRPRSEGLCFVRFNREMKTWALNLSSTWRLADGKGFGAEGGLSQSSCALAGVTRTALPAHM